MAKLSPYYNLTKFGPGDRILHIIQTDIIQTNEVRGLQKGNIHKKIDVDFMIHKITPNCVYVNE